MKHRIFIGALPLIGVAALALLAAFMIVRGTPANAQSNESPSQVCRTSIIIDRSGSVGNNMPTLKQQIRRLFQPTGLYDDKIHVAFWSFSHVANGNVNYNAPFNGYVSSRGEDAGFMNQLSAVQPAGNTNYQQGFAYNGETRNPALNDIIESAHILVFMTDGQPNSINQFGVSAEEGGRRAAQKHLDAGKSLLGGSIGANAAQVRVINYVVSNNRDNYDNTFTVSTNYNDLALKLKERIATRCSELFPPDPCEYNDSLPADSPDCVPPQPAFSLVPIVTSDNTVISSDESAGFQYRVRNESATTTTPEIDWSIKRVVVDPNQSADPLLFGSDTYRDNMGCAQLLDLVNNLGTCDEDIAAGKRTFTPGETALTAAEAGAASRLVVEDRWAIGTKVCYVLMIAKPTEQNSPTNRHSRAACVVIGKRPTVQIWGGDLTVGGVMPGDPEEPSAVAAKIQTGLTIKGDPINRVFGSWVEYGVFAPGPILGLGSAAGLESGYLGTVTNQQGLWSRLTFANENEEYGAFSEARVMPNVGGALLAHQTPTIIEGDTFTSGAVESGVYEKSDGNLTVDESILGKGKAVTVHVPNGTVTISGNLTYTDETMTTIAEIPRLVIIARNINIASNATNVDAWLIARNSQTSTGGGVINTCSDSPDALTIHECNLQLRINGAVMARYLVLKRTAGAGTGEASDQPAEIINLRADAYLSSLARRTDRAVPRTSYSVELPPRF